MIIPKFSGIELPVTLELRVTGYRDLYGRFMKADTKLINERISFMRNVGQRIVQLAKEEAPGNPQGEFKKSFTFIIARKGSVVRGEFLSPEPLTSWIVRGTRPHTIRVGPLFRGMPIFQQTSTAFGRGGRGGIFYYRKVKHPGTKPNPFVERVAIRIDPEISDHLARVANNWSIKFTGGNNE